ncbi:exonuclease SbcC [Kribbella orskensis]|uniref:Nuclease SbcCD subunit C n=1 Tax=Kribbella orskensis TaxID=2512216 RepID=A0ABY2BBR7_9ACTN|nr:MULTISPECIES: SMC family ATPase [Kribbella]TCN32801.1 exonuclease SbcC [Kribbella sp. VKM Ac-2500]TCO12881.1 exonuclease SbcC [Kribbella orskensis]
MRPVRLDLDGFATFRTNASIDFTDVEYFALVGATGAGKSTVIDAITFALYGTVPRWNDQRLVAPALAPTATRAVVRLVFDAEGQRYAVAREARRSGGKTSRVTMHASRLERLHDLSDLDGDSEVLAADSEVTAAVERLLGLNYQHFTTCVALPQGRFAEFLHAKASDRQEILSSLLGYQLYDDIHTRANSLARDHRATVKALDTALAGYADATADAVRDQIARADRLNSLQIWVNETGMPALDSAAGAVEVARSELRELTTQQTALGSVLVPANVSTLDAQLTAATAELEMSETALGEAEGADSSAATAVSAFRPRFELLTLQRQWADLAEADAALPGLITNLKEAEGTLASAQAAMTAIEEATELLRGDADKAAAAATRATEKVADCEHHLAVLAGVTPPDTIADLASTLADFDRRRNAVDLEIEQADEEYNRTRSAVDAQASDTVLAAGLQASSTVVSMLRADLDSEADRRSLADAVTDAAAALTNVRIAEQQAVEALDAARRADAAGELRSHLQVGEACPVCRQSVTDVPDVAVTGDVADHEKGLVAAREKAKAADRNHAVLDGRLQTAVATRTAHLAHVEAARNEMSNALARLQMLPAESDLKTQVTAETNSQTVAQIADAAEDAHAALTSAAEVRRTLVKVVEQADARRVAGSDARRALNREAAAIDANRRAATTALHTARDLVSARGAPAVDASDLASAWTMLTTWAEDEHKEMSTRLPSLRSTAKDACDAAAQLKTRHESSTTELNRLRSLASDALQNVARSKHSCEETAARQEKLREAIAGQPEARTVAELLTQLDSLEQVATDARAQLEAARDRRSSAQVAIKRVSAGVDGSRDELAAIRDPLTRYGAPMLSTGSLATAWGELADWAADTAERLVSVVETSEEAVDLRATAYQAAATALMAALTRNELAAPAANTPLSELRNATVRIAVGAAAEAKSDADHAADRLAEREKLERRRSAAVEEAQIAGLLAQLLRSDGFRAWLLDGALASLVADASAILFEMSSGQFELRIYSKDLEVIDHNDADSARPVRTLSGGETFQASLALALALSRQVATLSASGSAKLESIFLDEGFGTLDDTSLEVVADTLETLVSSGERMVGVITHVRALAERVPVQFQVTRTGSTSSITRVGL